MRNLHTNLDLTTSVTNFRLTLYYRVLELILSQTEWSASGQNVNDALSVSISDNTSGLNFAFTCSEAVDWLSLTGSTGYSPQNFVIDIDQKNFTGSSRNTNVTVTATSPGGTLNSPETVSVTQGLASTCTLPTEAISGLTHYTTTNLIEVDGTQNVTSGNSLTLTAENTVTLGPGFHAQSGCSFLAEIDDVSEKDRQRSQNIVTRNTVSKSKSRNIESNRKNDKQEDEEEPDDPISNNPVTNLPTEYCLKANYPNPFNPTTTISFDLPANTNATLQVHNVKGQLIKTLLSGNYTAGSHQFTWNGDDANGKPVSSGIYFYKLKTNEFTDMKRMILLK
ncbi:MAG: T9SS type A sorting domain-containing protein [Candidatus Cloacimonetes bacterium]|nr:T9SS type A sorting domain-containing protein [Candidatus Cloacimonadota bacterium]MCF7868657.1 T9SS type A sorting domain-containing protein [Candidatus Cloacimonadota bacterium]